MKNISRILRPVAERLRSAVPVRPASPSCPARLLSLALLLATAAPFLASCEKILDIENDPSDAQLVVNAVPQAGKRAFVYFAHTRFFLDPSNNQPLDSAAVTLFVNGSPLGADSVANCKYFFPYTCTEGDTLTLLAAAGSLQATATTYVPYIPTFSNIKLANNDAGHTFRYYQAELDFQDHPGIDEYYNLRVMVRDSGIRYNDWKQDFDTVDTVRATYFMLRTNPEITGDASYSRPMLGYLYTRNFFNDSQIDGRNYHTSINILHLIDTNEVQPFKHEYTVTLESMTYARLRYLIDVSRQGSSNSFFTEQGQVRGNVDGALGIFAGSAKSEITFWPDTLPVVNDPSGPALLPSPEVQRLLAPQRH